MRRSLWLRLRSGLLHVFGFVRRDTMESRLREELELHLEMESDRLIAQGTSPAEAKRQAALRFGGKQQWQEASRDEYRSRLLDDLAQDLRYTRRTLSAAPAFAVAAALTLALGVGANTAVFSAVDAALFKPLPFSQPERIVALFQSDTKAGTTREAVAPGNFAEWQIRSTAFSGLAVAEPYSLTVSGADGVERVGNWNVTRDFFRILDVRPAVGRTFQDSDFEPAPANVVILTYGSWQRRFGGDPKIVGRQLVISGGTKVNIIGVLPRDFSYLSNEPRYEMFVPKVLDTLETRLRNQGWYYSVARLKPGVTLAQASGDMDRVAIAMAQEFPRTNLNQRVSLVPLHESMVGASARVLVLLFGAVGLVLLIACTNVATLMLARTARRRRELAIRVALGAGRGRIARQLLSETFVLALLGGTLGVALAYWGIGAIRHLSPLNVPRVSEMRVDGRALLFASAAVLLTTVLCGLAPALRAPRAAANPEDSLVAGSRAGGTRREGRLRRVFVLAEVSVAVMLLIGAGLLMRSFVSVLSVERGYRTDHVLSASVFLWQDPLPQRQQFVDRLIERLERLPVVEAAGITTSLPLGGQIGISKAPFEVEGNPAPEGEAPQARIAAMTPNALAAMGIRLLKGRNFDGSDNQSGPTVAIISTAMAAKYFPGQDALGRRVMLGFYGKPIPRTIVGIVADIRQTSLEAPPDAMIYIPLAQTIEGSLAIVARTRIAPRELLPELRRIVAELEPGLPLTYITTLDELVSDTLKPRRFTLVLLGVFSVVAFVLAAVGIYGVISNSTAERVREMSVRMALGAERGDILRLVLGQGLLPALGGVLLGIGGSLALTGLLRGMLFEVTPSDPLTYGAVAVLVLVTSVLACYLPARRATAADPVAALRAG